MLRSSYFQNYQRSKCSRNSLTYSMPSSPSSSETPSLGLDNADSGSTQINGIDMIPSYIFRYSGWPLYRKDGCIFKMFHAQVRVSNRHKLGLLHDPKTTWAPELQIYNIAGKHCEFRFIALELDSPKLWWVRELQLGTLWVCHVTYPPHSFLFPSLHTVDFIKTPQKLTNRRHNYKSVEKFKLLFFFFCLPSPTCTFDLNCGRNLFESWLHTTKSFNKVRSQVLFECITICVTSKSCQIGKELIRKASPQDLQDSRRGRS